MFFAQAKKPVLPDSLTLGVLSGFTDSRTGPIGGWLTFIHPSFLPVSFMVASLLFRDMEKVFHRTDIGLLLIHSQMNFSGMGKKLGNDGGNDG